MSTRRGWRASTFSVRITLQRVRERVEVKRPVRENCTPGSVRGAPGNRRPYRDLPGGSRMSRFYRKNQPRYLGCYGPIVAFRMRALIFGAIRVTDVAGPVTNQLASK